MELVILSIVTVIFCIFVYLKSKYSYWKRRSIETLPIVPFIGSYSQILSSKRHLAELTSEIYDKYYKEKYVGGFKGVVPELMVMDPDLIRSILMKDFTSFSAKGRYAREKEALSQSLSNLDGEKWKLLRQQMTHTFTSAKMKLMFPLIVECGQQLQNYLKTSLENTDILEVKEIITKYTTDTIGSCAFGIMMDSLSDDDAIFRRMGRKIFAPSKTRVFARFLPPFLVDIFNARTVPLEVENFFLGLVGKLISSRGRRSNRNDFIDLMMELRRRGSLGGNTLMITDNIIAAQSFTFFSAGLMPSSITMSYALRELSLNPDVQKRLSEEIDEILNQHNGKLTYEAVQDMSYLDMVINETLRKYPPASTIIRQCIETYNIPYTDIVIDKGVFVKIPVYALHHDEKYFPEPEKFMPERFEKDTEKTYHPFSYLPFGEGPRNCIATRFARLQTATGLISILAKYAVEKCEKTPQTLTFEPTSSALACVEDIWLKITERSQ